MEICHEFRESLELFNKHKVEYLVVGGYALAFHGAPRFTGDIDLYVRPVSFISREDLVANKKATGRKKDAADIEALGE